MSAAYHSNYSHSTSSRRSTRSDSDYSDYSDSFNSDSPTVTPRPANRKTNGKKLQARRNNTPGKTSHTPRAADNVTKRVISAKRIKNNELKNEIGYLKIKMEKLAEENKTLKRQQNIMKNGLNKYEDEENNLQVLIKRHSAEVLFYKEQIRKNKEKNYALTKKIGETDEELSRTRKLLRKMKGLVEDKSLEERDRLSSQLSRVESELTEKNKRIMELERYAENSQKNHRHELGLWKAKHREIQTQIIQMTDVQQRLENSLKEKEKELDIRNIYSNRLIKPPHKLNSSNSTPMPPPLTGNSSNSFGSSTGKHHRKNSDPLSQREKAKLYEQQRRAEEKKRREEKQSNAESKHQLSIKPYLRPIGYPGVSKEKESAVVSAQINSESSPSHSKSQKNKTESGNSVFLTESGHQLPKDIKNKTPRYSTDYYSPKQQISERSSPDDLTSNFHTPLNTSKQKAQHVTSQLKETSPVPEQIENLDRNLESPQDSRHALRQQVEAEQRLLVAAEKNRQQQERRNYEEAERRKIEENLKLEEALRRQQEEEAAAQRRREADSEAEKKRNEQKKLLLNKLKAIDDASQSTPDNSSFQTNSQPFNFTATSAAQFNSDNNTSKSGDKGSNAKAQNPFFNTDVVQSSQPRRDSFTTSLTRRDSEPREYHHSTEVKNLHNGLPARPPGGSTDPFSAVRGQARRRLSDASDEAGDQAPLGFGYQPSGAPSKRDATRKAAKPSKQSKNNAQLLNDLFDSSGKSKARGGGAGGLHEAPINSTPNQPTRVTNTSRPDSHTLLFGGGNAILDASDEQQTSQVGGANAASLLPRRVRQPTQALSSKPTVNAIDHLDDDIEEVIL